MSDEEVETPGQRYAVEVPSPATKLNLGKPSPTFGYKGASLKTEESLFIDIFKDVLFQGWKGYNAQFIGTVAQFAGSDMWLATLGSGTVASKAKMILASGAGQGAWPALDHGSSGPSLVSYNNLDLHYRTDEIQAGLYEFWNGLRERRYSPEGTILTEYTGFDSSKALTAVPGGYRKMATESLWQLFPGSASADADAREMFDIGKIGSDTDKDRYKVKHPIDPHVRHLQDKVFGDPAKYEYGFSDPFASLDPFKLGDPEDPALGAIAKRLVPLKNAITKLKRLSDVVGKFGELTNDFFVVRMAARAAQSLEALSSSVETLLNIVPFPEAIVKPLLDGYPDEAASHVKQRSGDASAGGAGPASVRTKGAKEFADDTAKAKVSITDGPYDLSALPGDSVTVHAEWNASSASGELAWHATTPQVVLAPALAPLASGFSYSLRVAIDAGSDLHIALTNADVDTADHLATRIRGVVGAAASVTTSGSPAVITIRSATSGASARLAVALEISLAPGAPSQLPSLQEVMTAVATAGARNSVGLASDVDLHGANVNVVNRAAVTRAELYSALFGSASPSPSGLAVSGVSFESQFQGAGSKVSVTGPAAIVPGGSVQKVIDAKSWSEKGNNETWNQFYAGARAGRTGVGELKTWFGNLQKLPSDVKNYLRPVMTILGTATKAVTDVEKVASTINPTEWQKLLAGPPAPLGIIGKSGISLGTPDVMVGSGSKGIVLIADGSSGAPDHDKFVLGEYIVKRGLEWVPKILVAPKKSKPPALGFRVLADPVADMSSTMLSQVSALGRGVSKADEQKTIGLGVARVSASYAAEIVGYNKVVISARHEDKADAFDKQGRVEVAGQTIVIGGAKLANQSIDDFADKDASIGIPTPALAEKSFASWMKFDKGAPALKKPEEVLPGWTWPAHLRKEHPQTKQVLVHSSKEATIVVGDYLVSVHADKGVFIGSRKPEADSSKNELDPTKPQIELTPELLAVRYGEQNKSSSLVLKKEEVLLYEGTKSKAARAQLELDGGTARMWGGSSKFEANDQGLKLSSPDVQMKSDSVLKLVGGTIKIG